MSGKSAAAIKESSKERLLIRVDLTRQDSMAAGASVVYSKTELVAAVKSCDRRRRTVICFRPEAYNEQEAFDFVCRVAIATKGRVAIHADEADTLINKNGALTQGVKRVLRQGRQHYQVALYYTALRPADINLSLRNNTQAFLFFRGFDRPYTNFVSELADNAAVEALKNLPDYAYILLINGKKWQQMQKMKL